MKKLTKKQRRALRIAGISLIAVSGGYILYKSKLGDKIESALIEKLVYWHVTQRQLDYYMVHGSYKGIVPLEAINKIGAIIGDLINPYLEGGAS